MKLFKVKVKIMYDNGKLCTHNTNRANYERAKEMREHVQEEARRLIKTDSSAILKVEDYTIINLSKVSWVYISIGVF